MVRAGSGGQLSEEVAKLSLGKGRTPYRMLPHPSGRLFLFADQPKGNLHRVDVALAPDGGPPALTLDTGGCRGGAAGRGRGGEGGGCSTGGTAGRAGSSCSRRPRSEGCSRTCTAFGTHPNAVHVSIVDKQVLHGPVQMTSASGRRPTPRSTASPCRATAGCWRWAGRTGSSRCWTSPRSRCARAGRPPRQRCAARGGLGIAHSEHCRAVPSVGSALPLQRLLVAAARYLLKPFCILACARAPV